jgi:ABC-type sugar transport system substrate-binding protein
MPKSISKRAQSVVACIRLFSVTILLLPGIVFAQHPIAVACIIPGAEDVPFWRDTVSFMRAVAEDLDIGLQVEFVKNNDISYKRAFDKMLARKETPEYLLLGRWGSISQRLLQTANERNMKILSFNIGFPDRERQIIGYPRGKLKNWLGELVPDNTAAGYRLADSLLNASKSLRTRSPGEKINVLGIAAFSDDSVSLAREEGLRKRIQEDPNAVLVDVVLGGWSKETSLQLSLEAFEENKIPDVIWAASDAMAIGAIDAAKQKGLQAGRDFVIGGFDWNPDNIALIQQKKVAASLGGQIFDGGWALIMLYDYHNGIDFALPNGPRFETAIHEITINNVDEYVNKLKDIDFRKIDFKSFTKTHNSDLKTYQFSFDEVLQSAHIE